MKKIALRIAVVIALLLVLAELSLRAIGMVDFPLYDANSRIGYVPKASQKGAFLVSHTWAFNALHMGTDREFDAQAAGGDVLLLGDSIVMGGNNFAQHEKLGARLEAVTHSRVWPIAAGSWALRNELIYLFDHPEVSRAVGHITIVLNSGDFDEASSWACELTHPRTRPWPAIVFAVRKYVYNWSPCTDGPIALTVPKGDWRKDLRQAVDLGLLSRDKTTVVLYPTRIELTDAALLEEKLISRREALRAVLGEGWRVQNIALDSRWNRNLYRDEIHPTQEGNRVLADILAHPLATPAPLP